MAMKPPTEVFDPIIKEWASLAGISTDRLSSIMGGQLIAGIVQVPLDLFLTKLGSKGVEALLGAAGAVYSTFGLKGAGRVQEDGFVISGHFLSEILDPSPRDVAEIRKNIGDLVDGVATGRLDKVMYAFVRNPSEFQEILPGSRPSGPPAGEKEAGKPAGPSGGIVYKL